MNNALRKASKKPKAPSSRKTSPEQLQRLLKQMLLSDPLPASFPRHRRVIE